MDAVLSLIATTLRVALTIIQNWSSRADSAGKVTIDSEELLSIHKSLNNLVDSLDSYEKKRRK